ncbi:MAG TPA: threonine/serine dehydratase [Chloroflexota bacterium]|nr:threonine/serine dehydratase [Chloroflexota bacterium]
MDAPMTLPGLPEIERARDRVRAVLVHTPMLPLDLDLTAGRDIRIKCENLQRTGSFKIRGAFNRIASLSDEQRARGVIAYSSGNHAQGVACAASLLGVRATVVMPENAIAAKVAATRRFGAEVEFAGTDSETRRRRAEELASERGLALVPPYDHPEIIAGQGTLGLEILEQAPEIRAVFVPIGGGGLVSGVALAIKALQPEVRVIGVEPEGAADAAASRKAGHVVALERTETIADGLRALKIGALPFEAIRVWVDDVVTVSDEAILEATRLLPRRSRVVAEPSGAVALAAALATAGDGCSVAVISGGNIDTDLLRTLLSGGHGGE